VSAGIVADERGDALAMIQASVVMGNVEGAKCESIDDMIERIAERTFQRVTGQSSKGMTKGDWEAMQARLHARDARLMGDERAARAWEQIAAEREGQ
jgi:hypothetical protein